MYGLVRMFAIGNIIIAANIWTVTPNYSHLRSKTNKTNSISVWGLKNHTSSRQAYILIVFFSEKKACHHIISYELLLLLFLVGVRGGGGGGGVTVLVWFAFSFPLSTP